MMLRQLYRSSRSVSLAAKNRLLNLIDQPVVILIYHRVTTLPTDPQMLAVTPDNFRAQLQFLKNNFPILRFEDDWSGITEPSVAITFDDGYADNALEALPVLDELGVPATFFVSTGAIGDTREFWWDELERIILGHWSFADRFVLEDNRFGRAWPTATGTDRQKMYNEIHPLIKKIDAVCRENWFSQLRSWADANEAARATHRSMTLDELQALSQNPWVTIGAHTVSHTPLSTLPVQFQSEEIAESKKQLENWLSKEITVFSYPFGGLVDYTPESVRLCKKAGFVKSAANFPGQAHRWSDPYQLPRQLVRNWPIDFFAKEMEQFWIS